MVNGQFLYLWEERDSNPRTQMGADLQSAAIATMRSSQKPLTHYLYLGSEWDSNPRKHAPQACAYTSRPSLPYFERHGRIELPSPAWQAGIITTILMPQNFYNHRLVEHPRLTILSVRTKLNCDTILSSKTIYYIYNFVPPEEFESSLKRS